MVDWRTTDPAAANLVETARAVPCVLDRIGGSRSVGGSGGGGGGAGGRRASRRRQSSLETVSISTTVAASYSSGGGTTSSVSATSTDLRSFGERKSSAIGGEYTQSPAIGGGGGGGGNGNAGNGDSSDDYGSGGGYASGGGGSSVPASPVSGTPEPSALVVWAIASCCGCGVVRWARQANR